MTPMEIWIQSQIEVTKREQPNLRQAYKEALHDLTEAEEKWVRFIPGYLKRKEKLAAMTKRKLRTSHNRLAHLKAQALERSQVVVKLKAALNASRKAVDKLEKIKAAFTHEMSLKNSDVTPSEITEMYKLLCLCSIDEDLTYQTISSDPEMLTGLMEDCLAKHKSHVEEYQQELVKIQLEHGVRRENLD